MDLLITLSVILHVAGAATIVAGWVMFRVQRETKPWVPLLVWAARAQILTGLLLVGLHEMADDDVNHAKVGVKLLIALAVAGSAEAGAARLRRRSVTAGAGKHATTLTSPSGISPLDVAGVLAVVNVLIAYVW